MKAESLKAEEIDQAKEAAGIRTLPDKMLKKMMSSQLIIKVGRLPVELELEAEGVVGVVR